MAKFSLFYRYFCYAYLVCLLFCLFFANFLASDLPIYAKVNGKSYYPLFQPNQKDSFPDFRIRKKGLMTLSEVDWHKIPTEKCVRTLIPYSTNYLGARKWQSPIGEQKHEDATGNIVPIPKSERHLLGTDAQDRDLFAGLIEGTRVSLLVAIVSILLITFIALSLGGLAAYFGDSTLKIRLGTLIFIILGMIPAYFYTFYIAKWGIYTLGDSLFFILLQITSQAVLFAFIVFIFANIGSLLRFFPIFNPKIALPIDKALTFVTDIQHSIPLFLLIALISLSLPKSISSLIIMIAFASFGGLARFSRTELARIAQMPYIEATKSMGYSPFRIIYRHILPNFYPILLPILVLGIADIIMVETSLSFLGIGVEIGQVTWGSMLNDARQNFSAWWLTLFPALAIFFTVNSLYIMGNQINKGHL